MCLCGVVTSHSNLVSGDWACIFPLKMTNKKFNTERFWSFGDAQMQGFYLFYESVTICIKPTTDTKKYI